MKVSAKLTNPLTEAKYLNAENADRYRCIMRIFFENYEKLKYWMYQEEVYQEMCQDPYFADYRLEQCKQDLTSLTEWKNLLTIQDTRKVASVEDFKNKRYRYQMSEYSVEIERLVLRLENLLVEGSSLEPTLLEKIRHNIEKFSSMPKESDENVYNWWNDLNHDFVRLNQNYQDYMRDLNSIKAEEMMRTKSFLIFKDRLIEYLRSFIKGLQNNVGPIEEMLMELPKDLIDIVLDKAVVYEKSIPRMDLDISEEVLYQQLKEKNKGRYQSIFNWFVGNGNGDNEAGKLFDSTNEIIRRITRYATQLSERNAVGANRREEYRKVAEIFMKCNTLEQAHEMSAMIFGLEKTFHLAGEIERTTNSMNTSVYEEPALELTLRPRIRNYSEKTKRSGIRNTSVEKAAEKEKLLKQYREDKKKLSELEEDGEIDFSKLKTIDARVREILLKWVSDALESENLTAKTEDGRTYTMQIDRQKERCVVHCVDGNFTMPYTKIIFQESEQ